jgi:hypothetical protein
MQNLDQIIDTINNQPSDINEHIPTLIKYASECDHITEMGVRGIISTWAFLKGIPKKLISYDIQYTEHWGSDLSQVYEIAKIFNVDYQFKKENVLKIKIEQTDLLFIDTWHTYDQLKSELDIHSINAKKYIIMHDTTSFEYRDESDFSENAWENGATSGRGLWPAIEEFLDNSKDWILHERFLNNNGLTILKRIK